MMKTKTIYKCPDCGSDKVKWIGSIYDFCNHTDQGQANYLKPSEITWTGTVWCLDCSTEGKPVEVQA